MDRNNNRSNQPRVPRGLQPAGDQDNVLNVDDNGVAQDGSNLSVQAQQNLGQRASFDSLHNIPFAGNANMAGRDQHHPRANHLRHSQQVQHHMHNIFHFRQIPVGQQGRIRQIQVRQMLDQFGVNWADMNDRAVMEQLYENLNFERQQIPHDMLKFSEEEKLKKEREDQQAMLLKYAGEEPGRAQLALKHGVQEEQKCDGGPSGNSNFREQQIMNEISFNAERRAYLKLQERMRRQNDGEIFSSLISQQVDLEARSCATVQSEIPPECNFRFNNERQPLDQVPEWKKSALQNQRLLMIFLQWQKQSHGLFDYELRHVVRQEYSISRSMQIVRNGTKIKLAEIGKENEDDKVDKNDQVLFTVTKQDNIYQINGVESDPKIDIDDCYTDNGTGTLDANKMHERMYHAVRFLKQGVQKEQQKFEARNYLLKKNDIVKLGRIKMKVKSLYSRAGHVVREKTLMRRRERLANEHMLSRAQLQKQRLMNPTRQTRSSDVFRSKYGKNYDQISLGSNASIHGPIVGEKSHATALTPIKRKRKRKSADVKKVEKLSDKQESEQSKSSDGKLKKRAQFGSFCAKQSEAAQNESINNGHNLPYVSSVVRDISSFSSINIGNGLGTQNDNSDNRGSSNVDRPRDATQEPVSRLLIVNHNSEESKHGSRSARSYNSYANDAQESPRNLLDQIAQDLNRIEPASLAFKNQREQHAAARRAEKTGPAPCPQGVIDLQVNGVFDNPYDPEPSSSQAVERQQQASPNSALINNDDSNLIIQQVSVENNRDGSNEGAGGSSSHPMRDGRPSFTNQNLESMGGIQQSMSAPNIGAGDQGLDFVVLSESSSSFFQSEREVNAQHQQQIQQAIPEVQQEEDNQKKLKLINLRSHDIKPVKRLGKEESKSAKQQSEKRGGVFNYRPVQQKLDAPLAQASPNFGAAASVNEGRAGRPMLAQESPEKKHSAGTPSQSSIDGEEKQSSDSEARKHEYSNPDKISIYSESPIQCRVCWGDTSTTQDPLLRVCQCRGGLEFIHFSCLKNWIGTKEEKSTYSTYTMIQIKQFECEICKSELPYVFMNNGNKYNLIDIPIHGSDHLILESISLDTKAMRIFFILHPNRARNNVLQRNVFRKVKYRIGRGHDCHLRLTDISASRNHADIIYEKGEFRLSDSMSKFGTLVLARKPLAVSDGIESAVQIGRSLVLFKTVDEPLKISKQVGFIQSKNDQGLSAVKSFHDQRKSFQQQEVLMERSGIKKPGDRTPKAEDNADSIRKFYGMSNFDFMAYLNFIEDNYYRQDIMNRQQMEFKFLAQLQQQSKNEENSPLGIDEELKNMGLPYDQALQKRLAVQEDLAKRQSHILLRNDKGNEVDETEFKETIKKEELDIKLDHEKGEVNFQHQTRNSMISSSLIPSSNQSMNNVEPISDVDRKSLVRINTQLQSSIAEVKETDQVGMKLNKGVTRQEHLIEPSDDFLKACRMFGQQANPMLNNGDTTALKERMTDHRNDKVEEIAAENRQRYLITWRNRVDYQNLRRAKFLQKEQQGQPLSTVMGNKLPKKIALSHNFFEEHIKVHASKKDGQSEEKSLLSEVADEQINRNVSDENRLRNTKNNDKAIEQAKMIKQLCFHRKKLMCQLIGAEEALKSAKFNAREAAEVEKQALREAAEQAQRANRQKTFEDIIEEKDAALNNADQIVEQKQQPKLELRQPQAKREQKTEKFYLQQVTDESRNTEKLREDLKKIDDELSCMKRFEEQHEVLKLRQKVIRNDIQRIWRLHVQNSEDNQKAQQDEHAKRRFR